MFRIGRLGLLASCAICSGPDWYGVRGILHRTLGKPVIMSKIKAGVQCCPRYTGFRLSLSGRRWLYAESCWIGAVSNEARVAEKVIWDALLGREE
jgi:hypothetical protein